MNLSLAPLFSTVSELFRIQLNAPAGAPLANVFREILTVEFSQYQYAHFSPDGFSAGIILTVIYGCFLAAILISAYCSGAHGDLIGSLCDMKADSPETARTLEELGFSKNLLIQRELRNQTVVARYLCCVEEEAYYRSAAENANPVGRESVADSAVQEAKPKKGIPPYRHTFSAEHYYLREDRRLAAETRFCSKRSSATALILGIVGLTVGYLLLLRFLPELFSLLDSFLSWAM